MKFKLNNQLLINTLVYTILLVAGYNTAIAQDDDNLNKIKPSSISTSQAKQFIVGYWKYNDTKTFNIQEKLVEKVLNNTLPMPPKSKIHNNFNYFSTTGSLNIMLLNSVQYLVEQEYKLVLNTKINLFKS